MKNEGLVEVVVDKPSKGMDFDINGKWKTNKNSLRKNIHQNSDC